MAVDNHRAQPFEVVRDLADFDRRSGSLVERLLFNHRLIIVLVCALLTALLGFQATKLRLNASFENRISTGFLACSDQ